uniref:Uncharacterized protein n=1 Tax=Anopheles merus TaxID=30066 RepID=A0A182VKK4_ANOME
MDFSNICCICCSRSRSPRAAGLWQPELVSIALIAATLASCCSVPSSPSSISKLAAVCDAWEEATALPLPLLLAAVSSFSLLTAIWARKSGPPAAGPAGDGGSGVAVEDDTVPLPGDGGTVSSGGPACMIAPSGPGPCFVARRLPNDRPSTTTTGSCEIFCARFAFAVAKWLVGGGLGANGRPDNQEIRKSKLVLHWACGHERPLPMAREQ